MRPLDEFVINYLSSVAPAFYIRQCLVILALFIFGAILTDLLIKKRINPLRRALLAFPAGLSAFIITAYLMLILGISYTPFTVTAAIVLITGLALFWGRTSFFGEDLQAYKKHMLIALSAAILIALVATAGIAPVAISNDTMYYFRRYPDAIVFYRGLRDQFDFFMTDTGLGVVAIDTLPALFGFGETFGIREFFHIDFIVLFGYFVYDRSKGYMPRKGAIVSSVLVTAFLAASTPFFILGHWALANMYFMEMFFIASCNVTADDDTSFGINCLIMTALSLLRIEGTLFVIWLVVCQTAFTGHGKKTAKFVILPVTLLFGGYCLRLYTKYNVLDNQYTFLTPQKAVILITLLVASGLFLIFIFTPLYKRFGHKLVILYIGLLVAGNLLMLVRDPALYAGNLKAFGANLFRQSGWGMFPYFVIGMILLIVVCHLKDRKKRSATLNVANLCDISMVVGFLLIVLAASYGRGDVLSEDVGDSGNRVLLQITPLVVMTISQLFLGLFYDENETGL